MEHLPKVAGAGPLSDYSVGQRVLTREGYAGVVTDILEGPADLTTIWVTLDNGLGGGEYAEAELQPLQQTSAQMASIPVVALENTAASDYPELSSILSDRPPPTITTHSAKTADDYKGQKIKGHCKICGKAIVLKRGALVHADGSNDHAVEPSDGGPLGVSAAQQASCVACGTTLTHASNGDWAEPDGAIGCPEGGSHQITEAARMAARLALYLPPAPPGEQRGSISPITPEQKPGYDEGFAHGREGITRNPSRPDDENFRIGYDLGWSEGVTSLREPANSWDYDDLAKDQTAELDLQPLPISYAARQQVDPDTLTSQDLQQIEQIVHEVRTGEGAGGQCYLVAEILSKRYGWDLYGGIYHSADGHPLGDHGWNVYAPTGAIIDATPDQWGEGGGVRVVKPGSPDFSRYRYAESEEQESDWLDQARKERDQRGDFWWAGGLDAPEVQKYVEREKSYDGGAASQFYRHAAKDSVVIEAGGLWDWIKGTPKQDKDWTSYADRTSYDWCRFRRHSHCWLPKQLNEAASKQAGYAVWVPFDRGICYRAAWDLQKKCPTGEPGPHAGAGGMTDATVPWDEGGQRGGVPSSGPMVPADYYANETPPLTPPFASKVAAVPGLNIRVGGDGEKLVAEAGGRQIGFLEYEAEDDVDAETGDPLITMTNLWVDPGYRRQGVAAALYARLLEVFPLHAIAHTNFTRDGAAWAQAQGIEGAFPQMKWVDPDHQGSLQIQADSGWVDGPAEPEYQEDFPGSWIYGGREAAIWYSVGNIVDPRGCTIHAVQVEPWAQRQGKATRLLDWAAAKFAGHAMDPGGLTAEGRPLWNGWVAQHDWPRLNIPGPHNDIIILKPRSELTEQQRAHVSGLQAGGQPVRTIRLSSLQVDAEDHPDEKHTECQNCGRPISWYAPRARDYWVHDHNDSPWCISAAAEKKAEPKTSALQVDAGLQSEAAFEVLASWADIREKAKRIRSEGGVRIVAAQDNVIVGHVRGDHGVYETEVMRHPGKQNVAAWHCGCKWAAYSWGRSGPWKRYEGRQCSHALALHLEAQARGMFGRTLTLDEKQPAWMDNQTVHQYGDYDRDKQRYSGLRALARKVVFKGRVWGLIRDLMIADDGHVYDAHSDQHIDHNQVLYPGWHPSLGLNIHDTGKVAAKTSGVRMWHGTPSGDLRGGAYGLHVGSREAAKQALEARIGIRADGKDWDGTQEYGKTLLMGRDRVKQLPGFRVTGYNADSPLEDHYPTGKAGYGDGTKVPMSAKPDLFEVEIAGPMNNTPDAPYEDFKANGYMKGAITRGHAKSGYFYTNVGEDEGSVSAVVPGPDHVRRTGRRTAAKKDDGPSVSGVALKAADTGRVLMLQRQKVDNDKDPAAGTWEFPGGHHDDGDLTSLHAAIREWEEEVGQPFPEGGTVAHTWTSPDGVYQGHLVVIPEEAAVNPSLGRTVDNPDDPGGDYYEAVAWWDPDHARKNPAIRPECKATTPWAVLKRDLAKAAAFLTEDEVRSGGIDIETLACVDPVTGQSIPFRDWLAQATAKPKDVSVPPSEHGDPRLQDAGVSVKRTPSGKYYVHTHRARGKYRDSVADIPDSEIEFIRSTGAYMAAMAAQFGDIVEQNLGRCYELAGERVVTSGPGAHLVHGTIQNFGKPPLDHAWVELGSGKVWEPATATTYSAADFADLYNPVVQQRYTTEEAARLMVQTGNYGPWTEAEEQQGLHAVAALTKTADEDQCPACAGDSLPSGGGGYSCQDCGHQWHPDDIAAQAFHGDGPLRGVPLGQFVEIPDLMVNHQIQPQAHVLYPPDPEWGDLGDESR